LTETQQVHGDGAWSWPCPYCGTSNALDASACIGCGAQLRDPEEDDLFTTLATHNAQMVDPQAPRVRESLWSTEAAPGEQVAEEVVDPPPSPAATDPQPAGPTAAGSLTPESPAPPGPQVSGSGPGHTARPSGSGPFSPSAPASRPAQTHVSAFSPMGEQPESSGTTQAAGGPFGVAGPTANPQAAAPVAPAGAPQAFDAAPQNRVETASHDPSDQRQGDHAGGSAAQADTRRAGQEQPTHRPTPDEHGLSVAVESLSGQDRERCDTPIAVVGALLGEQEVVLGLVAGHLLGHPAIVALTSTRVLVANARRWKPLVDQFIPDPELMVHLRHDRDIASVTFVQGQRLTGVDDITDVTAAVDLVDRIRAAAARAGRG
jgi:hypothetical protein